MKFYIDIATRRFVRGPASSIPLDRTFFKRRDKMPIEIVFVEKSAIVPTPAGTTFSTGLKTAFADAEFLAISDSTGLLDLYTTGVEALFADDPATVSALLEVKTSRPGEETRTSTLAVDLENSVILGDESTPSTVPSLKATEAEATAGTDNEKWMTPLRTAQAIAALAASDWPSISGKPELFPPSAHSHPAEEITGLEDFVIGATLFLRAFDSDGLTTYSGRLREADRPPAPTPAEQSPAWHITRTIFAPAGNSSNSSTALGAWVDRETLF